MEKGKNTFYKLYRRSSWKAAWRCIVVVIVFAAFTTGCDLIKLKKNKATESERQPIARVSNSFLYKDEMDGFVAPGTSKLDSAIRVEAFIESWIRKQLLIQEAARRIDIDEAEVERKILDYRYSIIAYEYQTYYIKQHLDTAISSSEIEKYYTDNIDNFILKQNIVQASFIKVPKTAPRVSEIKAMIYEKKEEKKKELKTYCLSFSAAYHISDSSWMVFDDLVRNSPLAEIPNKIQFLKTNPYYETSDDNYLYFFKVDNYRISDNVSPLEFVVDDIANIILNKRKVELAKRLEDEVYNNAETDREFEIYN
jgi:hypothetical protein